MRSQWANVLKSVVMLVATGITLAAHPMGNFSVNHYSRLFFHTGGVDLTYVLDLAEIPTFQLTNQWQIDWKDQPRLDQKSREQAREWIAGLSVTQNGKAAPLAVKSITATATEGAGGLPVLRISVALTAAVAPGEVNYEDKNFPGRAGWKEIVLGHDSTGSLRGALVDAKDLSGGLTHYPDDPSIAQPQDVTAKVTWIPAPVTTAPASNPAVTEGAAPAQAPAPTAPVTFSENQPASPGAVVRGDYLSTLLHSKEIPWRMILIGILTAFGLGCLHAMSPGHGKTIVAAYLVGSRGTLKHAGLLGFVVTFTHTFSVFMLGLGVLFFQQYVHPDKIVPVLAAFSGLSIVVVGIMLLYKRSKLLMEGGQAHQHGAHTHRHANGRVHTHVRRSRLQGGAAVAELEEFHEHDGATLVHSHGGDTHSHAVPEKVTLGSLIALGVSGGLVPCPSALVLMLSAIALGRPGLGLVLLIGFSAGLAMVLMGIGMAAIYAKHLLPDSDSASRHPIFRLVPVFSAVVVICLGMGMTAVAVGWIQPMRFLS